jgi:hypothetical protein
MGRLIGCSSGHTTATKISVKMIRRSMLRMSKGLPAIDYFSPPR